MSSWKRHEKQVAEFLGGRRRIRADWSQSLPDIDHKDLAIECKYGKQVPKCIRVKKATVLHLPSCSYIAVPFDNLDHSDWMKTDHLKMKKMKFIKDCMKQALKYPENIGKYPVLAVKWPGCKKFVVVMYLLDFLNAFSVQ